MKKKFACGIFAALVTVILCACMTACSTNIVGTYKFYAMKYENNGVKMDLKVGDSFMGMITLTEDYMVLTVNDDNTLTMSAMGETVNGTWKEEDGKYFIIVSGEEQEVKVSGNKLTLTEDGAELVLKK